jgi:hypothetical protein
MQVQLKTHQVIQNLFMNDLNHFEGLHRGNRIYEHVPVNAYEVLRVQDAIFILLCS